MFWSNFTVVMYRTKTRTKSLSSQIWTELCVLPVSWSLVPHTKAPDVSVCGPAGLWTSRHSPGLVPGHSRPFDRLYASYSSTYLLCCLKSCRRRTDTCQLNVQLCTETLQSPEPAAEPQSSQLTRLTFQTFQTT